MVTEAYKALKTVTAEKLVRDGNTLYGDYVADRLRSYDTFTQAQVKHRISNILFEADMGYYRGYQTYNMPRSDTSQNTSFIATPVLSPVESQLCGENASDTSTVSSAALLLQNDANSLPPSAISMENSSNENTNASSIPGIVTFLNNFTSENN